MDTTAAFREYRRSPTRALRNQLVEQYLDFAGKLANVACRRLPAAVERGDLEQAALVGLIGAVERFDPERGACFETFAQWRIFGAIRDELRGHDHLTRYQRWHLSAESEEFDARAPASFDAPVHDELTTLLNELGAEDPALERVERADQLEALELAVAELPERERMAVVLRDLEQLSGFKVGEVMGVTESRVSQLCTSAYCRMRPRLRFAA